jgi:hypothetical protein
MHKRLMAAGAWVEICEPDEVLDVWCDTACHCARLITAGCIRRGFREEAQP